MKTKRIHSDIYSYCSLNQFERAQNLLIDSYDVIDVMYEDGAFFEFAISKNNLLMLRCLLEYYYDKNNLSNVSPENYNLQQRVAKHKIQQVLSSAVETFDASQEIKNLLTKYNINVQEIDITEQEDYLWNVLDQIEESNEFIEHASDSKALGVDNNTLLDSCDY